jgi:hypothetical protein
MSRKIDSMEITNGRKMVEKERARLLKRKESDPTWWKEEGRSRWARNQFGPTLTEKDGTIHPDGSLFDDARCQICGEIPGPDEKILSLSFSFCEEYGCGMNICRKCLSVMTKKLTGEKP